jgi:formylmethanofuran dehydrogenase subunit E
VKEYRCTRNALYSHDCIGRDDLTARQGHYIRANSAEEAWEKMATRFPEETEAGFTTQEWESFNVKVVRVEPDEEGNLIEVDEGENQE